MSKQIKDPIYGYITIDEEIVKIIDSKYFQRLRNIIQTSYTAIYPSCLHNRFTHSLGVYYLGKNAFSALVNNSEIQEEIKTEEIDSIRKTFVLACLCHDLGHSPFSHTGEKFYNKTRISDDLNKLVNDEAYSKDLEKNGGIVGNEHEIMSALLALQVFSEYIPKEYYSLFARSIIGLQYEFDKNEHNASRALQRACVELLNSNIIDVDKLDYLIRDSYMSGYESISIDYTRLLKGMFVNDGEYPIGYEKSALSVLESVLTAHDMERRWIQSHPATLYEAYLIQTIIRELEGSNKENSIFSLNALKETGVEIDDQVIRLLSDADILHLAKKNYESSDAVKEYCDRTLRRHPFWKSEAEFTKLFEFKKGDLFIEILQKWEDELIQGEYGVYSINSTFKKCLNEQLSKTKTIYDNTQDDAQKKTYKSKIEKLEIEIELLSKIEAYLNKNNIPFDLVIISKKQFKSNIYKSSFKNLPIRFTSMNPQVSTMSEVSFVPLDTQTENEFFYLFYKRTEEANVNVEELSKELRRIAII